MFLFAFTAFGQKTDAQQSDDMVRKIQRAKQKAEIAKIFKKRVDQNQAKLDEMDPEAALALKERWYEEIKVKKGWYDFDKAEQERYLEEQVYGNNRTKGARGKKTGHKIAFNIAAKQNRLYDVVIPAGEKDYEGHPFGDDYILFEIPEDAIKEDATPQEALKIQKALIGKQIRNVYEDEVERRPEDAADLKKKFSKIRSDILKALNEERELLADPDYRERPLTEDGGIPIREQLEVIGKEGDIFRKDGTLFDPGLEEIDRR